MGNAAVFLYAAIRKRHVGLVGDGNGVRALPRSAIFSLTDSPDGSTKDAVYGALIMTNWIVGAGHALGTRRRVFEPEAVTDLTNDPVLAAAVHAQERRDLARQILAQDPQLASDLAIGRPDLKRGYDDGGLVDANSAPAAVLASLPGLTPQLADRIVAAREASSGFTSLEEMTILADLPPAVRRHHARPDRPQPTLTGLEHVQRSRCLDRCTSYTYACQQQVYVVHHRRDGDPMKAIVQDRYGSPDSLELREIDKPVPADNEVLVRVVAAAVNASDWHVMRGHPYLARLVIGLSKPKSKIRGRDFAGRVEAVGRNVHGLQPGDDVYGDLGLADGAFAEYVCVPDTAVELKPANLTFEQAATVPLSGSTALVGLRDAGGVVPGQRVLINGASGGVGTFAVQIAKSLGAEVTAVCSTKNADLVRSIGADHVVDYTREDFTATGERYDVVLDLVGNRSLTDLRRALTPAGTLVLSGGGAPGGSSVFGPMSLLFRSQAISRFVRQRLVRLTVEPSKESLAALRGLCESGQIMPVIDRTYPLREVPEAIRYLEENHARAKIAITV